MGKTIRNKTKQQKQALKNLRRKRQRGNHSAVDDRTSTQGSRTK